LITQPRAESIELKLVADKSTKAVIFGGFGE